MREFDNLKTIWDKQKDTLVPEASQIIYKAKKEKKSIGKKIIVQVITLVLSMIVIMYVVYTINFRMATTFAGIVLLLMTIFLFSGIRMYQVFQLSKIDLTQSPKIVLHQLNRYYTFDKFVKTKCMISYFVFLNIGMGLYFIEVMKPMSLLLKSVSLILYIAWMLFAYFVIGRKQLKKDNDKIESVIKNIKNLEQNYEK